MNSLKRCAAAVLVLAVCGFSPAPLWGKGLASVDAAIWDRLLERYLADGRVDYRAWKHSSEDRRALAKYLEALAGVDAGALEDTRQIAHYLNLYNASMVELVLRHYPVSSVKKIGGLLGPWKIEFIASGADTISLDRIEHGILRQRFREPRIHFALVCASVGCPPLRKDAYTGERLDAQLEEQQRAFLLDPTKNRGRIGERGWFRREKIVKFEISSIFDWFVEDFGGEDALIRRIAPLMGLDEESLRLARAGQYDVEHLDYDWSLNDRR